MAYCTKCGKELLNGSNYCYYCGNQVIHPLDEQGGNVNYNGDVYAQVEPEGTSRLQSHTSATRAKLSEEELEELGSRRLKIWYGILSVLCPPGGIAFTIVHYATHRKRAGRQALVCTIIGFAIWIVLYIIGFNTGLEEDSTFYDNSYDWYDL